MTNPDENVPPFFNNNFFSTLLQEHNSKRINVLSFKTVPAVGAGNNYCSIVYRVHVEYQADDEIHQTSLIVKTPLGDVKSKDTIEELGIIDKECKIYKEILPLMDEGLRTKIIPKHYPCTQPDTLILEDLKDQGYVMCDSQKQLDFDHCNMFMKTIAIFHASSVCINQKHPKVIERVRKHLMYHEDQSEEMQYFQKDTVFRFSNILEKWGGFNEFVKLYRNYGEELLNQVIAVHNTKKHLRVLNHGDVWTNNLLFKHDQSGKVIDMKLIDFQVCHYSSPAIDLIIFIVSSAQEDVKDHRLPELYATYLETLNSTLKSLGCEESLTADELQDELKFAECFHLCLLMFYLPFVLNDQNNLTDLDKVIEAVVDDASELENNPWMRTFKGEKFKDVAKYTLRKLDAQSLVSSKL